MRLSIHIVHNVVSIAVMSLGATQCTKLGYDSTQCNNVIARHVCVCVHRCRNRGGAPGACAPGAPPPPPPSFINCYINCSLLYV